MKHHPRRDATSGQPQRDIEIDGLNGLDPSQDDPAIDDPGDAQRASKSEPYGDGEEELR